MKSSLPYFHLFYVLQLTYFPFPYHCLTSITNWDLVGLNYQHKVMSSPLSSLFILTYCYLSINVKGILPSLNCSWYLHKYACMHACMQQSWSPHCNHNWIFSRIFVGNWAKGGTHRDRDPISQPHGTINAVSLALDRICALVCVIWTNLILGS